MRIRHPRFHGKHPFATYPVVVQGHETGGVAQDYVVLDVSIEQKLPDEISLP